MMIKPILFLAALQGTGAFQNAPTMPLHRPGWTTLFMSTTSVTANEAVSVAKQNLIVTAERLKSENGAFLVDSSAKKELEEAVRRLEDAKADNTWPDMNSLQKQYLGEWNLLCTTTTSPQNIPNLAQLVPRNNPLRESLVRSSNRFVQVVQRIRSTNEDGTVDRVDNVIEYEPPTELGSILPALPNLPEQLVALKLPNPLQVSKSKICLCHSASVVYPVADRRSLLTTKIRLTSVVLNVAGKSTVLDPNGKDVFGVNFPAVGDFLSPDSNFETTYLDETLRISRGKVGLVERLRVFIRKPENTVERMDANQEDDEYKILDETVSEGGGSDDSDLTPSA